MNEFGKLEFSSAEGAVFTGQFNADHSFSGTWKGTPGTGTFSGGVGGPSGNGGTGGGGNAVGGNLLTEARSACQATLACDGAPANCSMVEAAPPGCENLELQLYQCVRTAKCTFKTACQAQTDALVQCVLFGTQPDPGTGYMASGNDTSDEATVLCEACKPEATACHDLPECWEYAVCAEACPGGETYCVDNCWDAHPARQ